MTVPVHIFPNKQLLLEIPDDTNDLSVNNNERLSYEEFLAALERLDALARKFAKPDAQPLSDYAMSRESIYEDHPKL
ncbi:MAG: hypothetical protein OXM61_02230 [Candidatus Poribacteria bacterium]|nr:hypothetical protein [Candidatus Poribacteria bacterium]